MNVAIVDYGAGNVPSVERGAAEIWRDAGNA